jgi:anti-sigma regulatory factor (Ser/Thr protein kinase)
LLHPAEHQLTPEPASVRAARQAVRDAVRGIVGEDTLADLLLATSELVTNAVEHGAPPIALLVEGDEHRVRVEVRDGSPLRPRPGSPRAADVRGRGIQIVEQLAHRWGVDEHVDGKSVWLELDLRDRQAG